MWIGFSARCVASRKGASDGSQTGKSTFGSDARGYGGAMNRQGLKKTLIIVHDLVMTGIAILATFYVRFEGPLLSDRLVHLPLFLPPFIAFAGVVYGFSQLYRSKW